jgi:Flp pilus assembly protein TadD
MSPFAHVLTTDSVQSSRSPIASHRAARDYFVTGTTLLGERRFGEAEACFREALSLDPEDADILNNLGTAVWEQGRASESMAYYLRAHQFKPRDFGILNNVGIALWDQGRPDRAVVFYRRALEIRPDSFDTRMNLGVSLSDLGQFDDALYWIRASLELNPDSADAWDNLGMTLARQGHWQEAMASYDRAIALRPDFGEAHRNRALGWLALGDFERGWPESEWRLKCRNPPGFSFPRPRWAGEPLDERTILLHWEQGLGDTLQFIRFAGLIKERGEGQVWVFCQPPLVRLVSRARGVDRVFDGSAPLPDFQLHAPLMSVPAIVGTTQAMLPKAPYLSADAATIERWRSVLQNSLGESDLQSFFKIGIAWQGSPLNRVDRWRSFPLDRLEPLANVPGVRLISLQKGAGIEQIRALDGKFPVAQIDPAGEVGDDKRDFLDTAAVMSLLDLVVTPETAVAHLAGSLGVRTWVALSSVGDWRWMVDEDVSTWYPSARLFRQTTMGDWDGVFRRMGEVLAQEIGTRVAEPTA